MPERPASTIAIWAVAAVLAGLAGARLLGGDEASPAPVRLDGPGASAGDARDPSGAIDPAGRPDALYVHVAGAVRRPGLFRIRQGARTASALARAGGPTPRADLTLVNLAAELQDGQQIVVPVRGAAPPTASGAVGAGGAGAGGAGAGATGAPARIHLSAATVDQLDEIDGIGPTLAERIVEYRDTNGGFGSLEELGEVEGIGEKRLETLRDALQP
jgi:competence protein ComEA